MNKTTKLTLENLMKRKEQMLAAKKTKETEDIYVPSLDASVTIEEPDAALCRDAADMEDGEGDKYLCYKCIIEPNLKDSTLQKEFNCSEPADIVKKIFKPGEIPQIAQECIRLAGYNGDVKVVKN